MDFNDDHKLTEGDFFFQSFCGAFYEPAHKYGKGIGLEDDVWFTAEEWNIQRMFEGTGVDTNDTLGLASVVVNIANETAYIPYLLWDSLATRRSCQSIRATPIMF